MESGVGSGTELGFQHHKYHSLIRILFLEPFLLLPKLVKLWAYISFRSESSHQHLPVHHLPTFVSQAKINLSLVTSKSSAHPTLTQPPTTHTQFTMPQTSPRERLSLYTHRTLSHDVAAALKASPPLTIRTTNIEPTPAPPPSPVDFGSYASDCASDSGTSSSSEGAWITRRKNEQAAA
ncbi:hypothetical protein EG328_004666 [Venturia inaequalis]|uniref:Uncharacterized protein n=1 Tax=Venturia inaequalis TaxID=5025 RepID=A0A8H3UPQ4_VENIN|nr:hypothetical protein EG328_004666 [Venturia inaequalis]KAE9988630.1 hypothetical protein EG327_003321 [Venturia inaequalis]